MSGLQYQLIHPALAEISQPHSHLEIIGHSWRAGMGSNSGAKHGVLASYPAFANNDRPR